MHLKSIILSFFQPSSKNVRIFARHYSPLIYTTLMKSRFIMLAALAVFTLASCMKKEGAAADAGMYAKADSMKNVWKAMAADWDAGKSDNFDKYVSANFVDHDPMPGGKAGLAGMKDMATMMKAEFSDMQTKTEDMRVDGDVITARFSVSGTNTGPMMMGAMPATNKKMTDVDGIEMMRWENGKFVERWGVFNGMKMMMQLGLMPMPSAAPAGDMGKPMDKGMEKKKM
jgi:predicted ester cyclase